jgi:hypothetical protein
MADKYTERVNQLTKQMNDAYEKAQSLSEMVKPVSNIITQKTAKNNPAPRREPEQRVSLPYNTNNVQNARQAMMYQPAQDQQRRNWHIDQNSTTSEVLARIYDISRTDRQKANELYNTFSAYQQQPGSAWYAPYKQATNPAIAEIAALGIDVSGGINEKWFQDNAWLKNEYRLGSSGSPLAPAKKSSNAQDAAYWYDHILDAEQTTQAAEKEWAALQEEVKYWANRKDRNYSDEEILGKIDWSQYKTLQKMDEATGTLGDGQPTFLNRPIGYTQDNLKGVIWAARNNGSTGDPFADATQYVLGNGNKYQANEEISRKLDPASEYYSPYSAGSTLDDAALYFGVESFSPDWLAKNRGYLNNGNETDRKMYNAVYKAEQTTLQAEDELDQLRKQMDNLLKVSSKPEDILKRLKANVDDLPMLQRMDESMISGGDLVGTTRAVGYSWNDIEREVRRRCDEMNSAQQTGDFVADTKHLFTPVTLQNDPKDSIYHKAQSNEANATTRDNNINAAGIMINDLGTPEEKVVFTTAYNGDFESYSSEISRMLKDGEIDTGTAYKAMMSVANAEAAKAYPDARKTVQQYEELQRTLEENQKKIDEIMAGAPQESEEEPKQKGSRVGIIGTVASAGYSDVPLKAPSVLRPQNLESRLHTSDNSAPKTEAERIDFNNWARLEDNVPPGAMTPENEAMYYAKWREDRGITDGKNQDYINSLDDKTRAELYAAQAAVEEITSRMADMQPSYDDASKQLQEIDEEYAAATQMRDLLGSDAVDISQKPQLEMLADIGNHPVQVQHSQYTAYDAMRQQGKSQSEIRQAAKNAKEQLTSELNAIQEAMEQVGPSMTVSGEFKRNIEGTIAMYEREIQAADYVLMQDESGFAQQADAAKARIKDAYESRSLFADRKGFTKLDLAVADPTNLNLLMADTSGPWDYAGFMTDEERNTYLYLRETQGKAAAKDYFDYLSNDTYGVLQVRQSMEMQKNIRAATEQAPWLMNIVDVLASPTRAVGGIYSMYQYLTGQDINPYSQYYATNTANSIITSVTNDKLEKEFGEGTFGTKVAQLGYGVVKSAAESGWSAMVFGGVNLGSEAAKTALGKFGLKATEAFISAAPMGMGAMGSTVQEVIQNGGSIEQAMGMGAVTFLAETVSEAVSIDNILDAFKGGAEGTKGFIKTVLESAVMEGSEEIFGGIAEQIADDQIMGELSKRKQLKDQYISAGYDPDTAEKMAARDIFKDILMDGLSGALSGGLSTGVSYGAGAAINAVTTNRAGRGTANTDVQRQNRIGQNVNEQAAAEAVQENTAVQPAAQEETTETPHENRNGQRINEQAAEAAVQDQGEAAPKEAAAPVEPAPAAEVPAAPAAETPAQEQQDSEQRESLRGLKNDVTVLTQSLKADEASQTASVAAVLTPTDGAQQAASYASAAAQHIGAELGTKKAAKLVRGILLQAANNIEGGLTAVKNAIVTAGLNAGGRAHAVLQNMAENGVTLEGIRSMISAATAESSDPNAVTRMQNTVIDNMVAQRETQLIADGALNGLHSYEVSNDQAQLKLSNAKDMLSQAQKKLKTLGRNLQSLVAQLNQDPGNIKLGGQLTQANKDLKGQREVVHEYEQSVANAQAAANATQETLDMQREQAMKDLRNQAMQDVMAAQEQAAAEQEAARQAEIAQAEADAAKQAEEDIQSGKVEEDAVDALAAKQAEAAGMDEAESDAFRKRVQDRYSQLKSRTADLSQSVTSEEATKIIKRMARKLGVEVRVEEMPIGRGKYENGVITLSNKLTVGQAMVEAALHEVTHAIEGTNAYASYSSLVLGMKYATKADLDAAIDQKIADYKKNGVTLTPDGARRELVAEFARTDLHNKDTVYRLVDGGLGGTIRNALHNINQYLKNMRLSGQERVDAENLRKAERLFAKALHQKKMTDTHPTETQFSIPQMAQAMGLTFDENTLQLSDPKTGRIVENVTPDMLDNTPIGKLIDTAASGLNLNGKVKFAPTISQETAAAQKQMFADLMSMCAKYKDSDLVWEIASSTLSSQFSALKSNSDPQYGTTIDFGTVCAKTQEIINVLSQTMLEKGRGLTREEIMTVYNETYNAGLTVPCPVCYVFSRWMGVPSLLGQMKQYQQDYVVTDANGNVDIAATQKKVDAYVQNAQDKYGDAKAINKANGRLNSSLKRQEENRVKYLTQLEQIKRGEITEKKPGTIQKKLDDTIQKMVDLDKRIGELSAYNWITQALCTQDENGKFTVDPNFRVVPDEVLFDLNRTGEFAKYQKSWRFRNTRGAGMGKAILPYSGETIGDIVSGTTRWAADQNPYLNMDDEGSVNALNNAIARAKKQNLVGGQRLQSTSDFRPEWGLDYMMSFLELQAIGSKAQLYTKVSEAVDLLASVGADVNLSIMGKGQGWHVDENGKYVLDFSDVTGMPYETAKGLKDKYDNVQMILVGMNDTHIRLAMADSDIDFIIPWHSSGNSKDVLSSLIKSVGEHLDASVDYTKFQTDMVKGSSIKYKDENGKTVVYTAKGKQSAEEKARWNARVKMLTGKELTLEERTLIYSDPYLKPLYDRFYVEGVDPDCYGVKLPKSQAEQIFPYEYWVTDPSQPGGTKATADVNGQRFVEYCESFGLVPRFSQFKNDPGYWKLLIDRSMYDLNGNYRAQQVIDVTNAKIGQLQDGHLTNSQLPLETSAKYGSKYSDQERQAVENSIAAIDAKYDVEGSFSVGGDITDADIDQTLNDAGWMTESQSNALDSDFAKEYDAWDKETTGVQLKVAHTSQTLQDIGVPALDIMLSGDKINAIKRKHPGMTDNVIKQIPSIVEDPLLVMKSRTVADRITMFGELLDDNGVPVLAVLTTTPTTNNDASADILVLNSAYGKDTRLQDFINNSEILYEDNKRADQWAAGLRLQLPSTSATNGSSDINVAQDNVDVNTEGQNSIGGYITDADIDQMLSETGLIQATGNAPAATNQLATQTQMPTQTQGGGEQRQRQFGSQTAQRSNALHDEVKEYLRSHSGYDPDTNRAQIDRSIAWVQEHASSNDPDGYHASLDDVLSDDFNYASADGQARMLTVLSMAALQGDTANEMRIADAYNRQGTEIGRALQARNIFAMMTPLGRIATLNNEMSRINQQYIARGSSTRVALPQEILQRAADAKTSEEFIEVQRDAWKALAAQMPPTFKEQLQGWRMLGMLGNPRTHIRNIIGNAIFMPAVKLKNVIGTALEAASPMIKNGEMKTKALHASKENRQFARSDALSIQDILTGEKKFNPGQQVEQERDQFRTKLLQKISDFNSWALEAEDWIFLRKHYTNALSGWMQANKVSPADMQANSELLQKGRTYAIEEAQKATYRDANEIASLLTSISQRGGLTGFIVDAALPFKKTPANILRRGIEYSPVGLMRTLATGRKQMAQYAAWQSGELKQKPKHAMSPTQYLDSIASGLSGSAIMALGAVLANMGAVTVGLDDDEDEFEKLKGRQEYALNLSLFGTDVSYTIDWAAPVCMPFFVGASIYDALTDERELDIGSVVDSMLQITEPVFNLSMLDGVNSLLQVSSFSSGNPMTQIAEKLGTNYVSSYVPTLLGQVSRTIDPVRRKSYVESGASLSTFRYALEQAQNKTPYSTKNIPYRNPWGEEDRSSPWMAAFENFISPGYISVIKDDALTNELSRLYDETGESSAIPQLPAKTLGKTKLNDKQYDEATVLQGTTARSLLEELTSRPEWNLYDDADKASLVENIWKYVKQTVKVEVTGEGSMDKWVATAKANGNAVDAVLEKHEEAKKAEYKKNYKEALFKAIDDNDYESATTCIEALQEAGVDNVKTSVTSQYKPLYKAAYDRGDLDTMTSIETMLMSLGLGYKMKDFNSWMSDKK